MYISSKDKRKKLLKINTLPMFLTIALLFCNTEITFAQHDNPMIYSACPTWEKSYEERKTLSEERIKALNSHNEKHRNMLKAIYKSYKQSGHDLLKVNIESTEGKKQYSDAIYAITKAFKKSHSDEFSPGFNIGWSYLENLHPDEEGIIEYDRVVYPAHMNQITIFSQKPKLSSSLEIRLEGGSEAVSVCTGYHDDSMYKWKHDEENFSIPIFSNNGKHYDHSMPRSLCTRISLKDGSLNEEDSTNLEEEERFRPSYSTFLHKFKGPPECQEHGKYAIKAKIKDKEVVDSAREPVPPQEKSTTREKSKTKAKQTTAED